MSTDSPNVPGTPVERIGFRYTWTPKVTLRAVSAEEKVVLLVSPKFATVHDHVSFQWNLKIHGTTGNIQMSSEDDLDGEGDDSPIDYIAVELYFVDGPVSTVDVKAVVAIIPNEPKAEEPVCKESKTIKMVRGRGAEITDKDRTSVSQYIQENIGNAITISVQIKMDAKWFDPYTYLDSVSPTPQQSFLTTNYNARVNSKIWRKRSRKKREDNGESIGRKEKVDYEAKFQKVMDEEREKERTVVRRNSSRRGSLIETCSQPPDHEHLFKKLLVSCCESCERRRSSFMYDSKAEESDTCESGGEGDDEEDDEEKCFECTESSKEHIHDLLANMYFNKVVLPSLEYVEDFCDFFIDAELNDLPVLKRACERYLCGELNSKKALQSSLVLDLLFLSIVFHLPVMKSMTLSELSQRTEELSNPEELLEQAEFKSLDKRIRSLSDRNLVELIEQVQVFKEQRSRVQLL